LPNIKLVPTATCDSRETLDIHFHALTAQGYEGVMLRPNGPYEYGETPHGTTKRSEYLWKYKSWEDAEFRCLGVTQGQGKADIGIGALTLCSVDPIVLGNRIGKTVSSDIPTFACGTGFDDSERIEYMKNPPIGKLVKVRYLCLSADGIPLNPSFLAVLS
jgi:ATP-dependent DNA ligase